MSVRFSVVYPTRHRPAFIGHVLAFLEHQEYQDFEVIICDNSTDPARSCEPEYRRSALANVTYVHPPRPLGMVENWNYALQHVTGDYICYFTDKMLLLPDTLSQAAAGIEASNAEIISWVDSPYTPARFPDYFGPGVYVVWPSRHDGAGVTPFDPLEELSKKGRAQVSRGEQDPWSYMRGKICFGAYRADLCRRVMDRTGALFHPISPDYTSMILGLSLARTAAELHYPGIVHVHTDLSNGGQSAIRDDVAFRFLDDLGNVPATLATLPVPGLYSASHNIVAHDYATLKAKFGLDFAFDRINWLVYTTEDLDREDREWSSPDVESSQRALLAAYIGTLSPGDREQYTRKLATRERARRRASRLQYARRALRSTLARPVSNWLRQWRRRKATNTPRSVPCATIGDVLALYEKPRPGGGPPNHAADPATTGLR